MSIYDGCKCVILVDVCVLSFESEVCCADKMVLSTSRQCVKLHLCYASEWRYLHGIIEFMFVDSGYDYTVCKHANGILSVQMQLYLYLCM